MDKTPPEVLEKWRLEFEDVYRKEGVCRDLDRLETGEYRKLDVFTAHLWFIRSRQLVGIDLPKRISVNDDLWLEPSEVHDAIVSQGYKTN